MRGKRPSSVSSIYSTRITPAGAGKTDDIDCYECTIKDHPRRCGENSVALWAWRGLAGSPPRMRGKLRHGEFCRLSCGITPADAGKTALQQLLLSHPEDHPRGCGENQAFPLFWACPLGSPPRMRGKQSYIPYRFLGHGITPADAGKTVG